MSAPLDVITAMIMLIVSIVMGLMNVNAKKDGGVTGIVAKKYKMERKVCALNKYIFTVDNFVFYFPYHFKLFT